MTKLTGGEAIVKSLLAQGVDTIFGVPGVHNDWFYNALYDEASSNSSNQGGGIRTFTTRHEQGAGYMALGYAMSSDKVGVFCVVPGAGLLNASTALATGYGLYQRMLGVVGQNPSAYLERGIGFLHEVVGQGELLRPLTKWQGLIHTPAEAPRLVAEAFRQLDSGVPRPVAIEAPMDVQKARADVELDVDVGRPYRPIVNTDLAERAAKLLGEAKNPLIIVGSGASNATEEVKQLAEMLQAPVMASDQGRGVLSARHSLSISIPAAHKLWAEVDVVLAIGEQLRIQHMYWGVDNDLKIIHIDTDPQAATCIQRPAVNLVARSEDALRVLLPLVARHNSVRASRADEMATLKAATAQQLAHLEPQHSYLRVIREALPDDGICVMDLTQVGYVSRIAFPVYRPRTYLSPGYPGTLGYGFASALGAKVANPDKGVLAVAGDGGFMFTAAELATAVQHNLAVVALVFSDNAYGNVKRMQKGYDGRVHSTDLHNPDFAKLAELFGAQGLRATSPQELGPAIQKGLAYHGPTVIEIPMGEVPSPWPFIMGSKVRGKR